MAFTVVDLREKKIVETRYTGAEFVSLLAEHVPERYQQAMRYFELVGSIADGETVFRLELSSPTRHSPVEIKHDMAQGQ